MRNSNYICVMQYEKILEYFYNSIPNYHKYGAKDFKPGLEKIKDLLAAIGNPEKDLKFIHIAGTNGKGSTCNFLSQCLADSGYKTGLFTSPHLFDFRERVRINNELISKSFIQEFFTKYKSIFDEQQPSFFELTFALALDYFKQEQVEICIIETGLGGRLDATNIIQALISSITNIGRDHTEFLGNTIKEITIEKGGIIKSKTPVVLGEMNSESTNILREIALKKECKVYQSEDFPSSLSNYQRINLNLAKTILKVLQNLGWNRINLTSSLDDFQILGRYQTVQTLPKIIIDVAHNIHGFKNLFEQGEIKNCNHLNILFAGTKEKDLNELLATFPKNSKVYFTSFSNSRSLEKSDFDKQSAIEKFQYEDNPISAFEKAKNETPESGILLICGSFYLIADLKQPLNLQS